MHHSASDHTTTACGKFDLNRKTPIFPGHGVPAPDGGHWVAVDAIEPLQRRLALQPYAQTQQDTAEQMLYIRVQESTMVVYTHA